MVNVAGVRVLSGDGRPSVGQSGGVRRPAPRPRPRRPRLRNCRRTNLGDSTVNPSLALHTAARRYCLERHAFWCERYTEIVSKRGDRQRDGYHCTPEALATFPRYKVLNAIRIELE